MRKTLTALEVLQNCYLKHCLDSDEIGWDELGNQLLDALCNEMGDEAYTDWLEKQIKRFNWEE